MPLSEEKIRKLKIGDKIELSGTIFTARDKAHLYLLESDELKEKLSNGIIYHCGPIVKKGVFGDKVIAAGPTTSERLSLYAPEVIKKYKIKAIIGKGGMDKRTLQAMKKYGCVYLAAIGGVGALIASSIKKVKNVYKKEFGMPEAIYELEIEDMALIVAMDSKGRSIYEDVLKDSEEAYRKLLGKQ